VLQPIFSLSVLCVEGSRHLPKVSAAKMLKSRPGTGIATQMSPAAAASSFDEDFEGDNGLLLADYCHKLDVAARQRLMWMKTSFRKLHECFKSPGISASQAQKALFQATVRGLYEEILLDRKSNFSITLASTSRCENLEMMLEAQQEHINNLELRLAHSQNAAHIETLAAEIKSLKTIVHAQQYELAANEDMKKSFDGLQGQVDFLTAQNATVSSKLDETMHMLRHSDLQNAEISKTLYQKTADMELQAQENRRLQIVLFSQRQQLAICIQQMSVAKNDRSPRLPQAIKSLTFEDGSEVEVLELDHEQRLPIYETLLDDLFNEPNDGLQTGP
jgi:hypothetical protein